MNYLHVEYPYDNWVILLLGDFVTADLSDPAAPLFRERKSAGGATGEAHRGGDVRVDARELNAGAREPWNRERVADLPLGTTTP